MGRYNLLYLENDKVYGCARCGTHLTDEDELISTAFMGSHGNAYLFNKIVNFYEGKLERKQMTTGVHEVKNIHCIYCQALVGWKYEKAEEESEKYKEGKFILEKACFKKLSL